MATLFESLSLKGLRLVHLEQLLSYIEERDAAGGGWYYGKREQFEKRHEDLKQWIGSAIKYAEENDVRFPK